MISLVRTAPSLLEIAPSRTYKTRAERVAIGRAVLEHVGVTSVELPRLVTAAAWQHGVSRATIHRAIDEALSDAEGADLPTSRAYEPCLDVYRRVAMHAGNVREAHSELAKEGHPGLRSYETLARALRGDLGILGAMRKGMKEFERFLEVGIYESSARLELALIDEKHVPIRCQDRYGKVIENLWLLSIMDDFSRLILAWAIVQGAVTADVAEYVLHAAVLGREIGAAELEDLGIPWVDAAGGPRPGFIGGSMDLLTPDHAKIFESERFKDAMAFCAVTPAFARPYIAVDKAKLERFHETFDLRIAASPGYLKGPVPHPGDDRPKDQRDARTGEPLRTARPYAVPADRDLPRVEAVVEMLDEVIEDYNRRHVISTTGQTPFQRWFSADTPIRRIEPILFWPKMLPLPNRATAGTNLFKVHPRGIFVDGEYLTHESAMPSVDTQVVARYLPGKPGRVFIGRPGGKEPFVGEVTSNAGLTEEERRARAEKNRARERRVRSILAGAGKKLKEDAGGGEDAEAPTAESQGPGADAAHPGPAPRRQAPARELDADAAATLALPFNRSSIGEVA